MKTNTRLATALLFTVALLPPLYEHSLNLWKESQYQFFPVIIISVILLYFNRGGNLSKLKSFEILPQTPWLTSVSLIGAVLLVLANLSRSPNTVLVATLILCVNPIYIYSSRHNSIWGIWVIGWILVRFPFEDRLIHRLQLFSSWVSSHILDTIGVNHLLLGNILHLRTRVLFIDEACSGIVSFISITAASLVYSVWRHNRLLRTTSLICSGVIWTTLLNIVRISLIAIAAQWWSIDLTHGWKHDLLGYGLFSVSLFGIYITDRALEAFLAPTTTSRTVQKHNILERFWNFASYQERHSPVKPPDVSQLAHRTNVPKTSIFLWCSRVSILTLFAACIIINTARWHLLKHRDYRNSESVRIAASINKEFLSDHDDFRSFQLIKRESNSPFGAFSKVYKLEQPESDFSVDYPFFGGWHELSYCYEGAGWTVTQRSVTIDPWPFVIVDLTNSQGHHGFLCFALVSTEGTPIQTPRFGWNLNELKANYFMRAGNGIVGETLQMQLWHPSNTLINSEQRKQLINRFKHLRSDAYSLMFDKTITISEED